MLFEVQGRTSKDFKWEGDISKCFKMVSMATAQSLDNKGKGHLISIMAVVESQLIYNPFFNFLKKLQKKADINWVSGRIHMSTVILCILLRPMVGFQFIFNTKRPLKAWPTGQLGNDWNSHCCAPPTFLLLLGS